MNQIIQNSHNLIIHGSNNEICVDSRTIAEEFEREHKSVLRTLDELIADDTISRHEFVPRTYRNRGREYRCIVLNEAGFLKAMPFIGGRKSREGQRRLVDQFLLIRKQLDRQSKMRESLAYQVARLSGKDSRGILTDAIKQYVDYARLHGSQHADRYYSIITKAIYAVMLILDPQATEVRELLTAIQLSSLATLELITAQVLTEGMEQNQPYKAIFQAIKKALEESAGGQSKVLA